MFPLKKLARKGLNEDSQTGNKLLPDLSNILITYHMRVNQHKPAKQYTGISQMNLPEIACFSQLLLTYWCVYACACVCVFVFVCVSVCAELR